MDPINHRRKTGMGRPLALIAAILLLVFAISPGARRTAGEGVKAFFGSEKIFGLLLYLETGATLRAPVGAVPPEPSGTEATTAFAPPSGETETAEPTDPAATEPKEAAAFNEKHRTSVSSEPPFAASEADDIDLRGNCSYAVDKAELLLRPLDWSVEPGPKLLIIHTHSSEAYTPSPGHEYEPDGDFRTLEPSASVIAVGDVLTEELGKLGVEVLHDRTCCDYPSYNRSYAVAREKIRAWLAKYPSIRMVIDLHRDAMETPVREISDATGEETAALMLVIGTDEGGLYHPRWEENLSCGLKLQALANRTWPGLFKPISFRKERFNGDLTPGSLIVEVGSTGNTLEEAEASMPALADVLSRLLSTEQPKSEQP